MAARKPKSDVDYSKSQDIKKIPFAEQMTTRMKPYMEALTNELTRGGIEAFDEYIENLPLPGELSDADNLSTGDSIEDRLDEIKESVVDNSARERITAVGASLKIISMLESFLADNERMSRELSKQEKLADDAEARKTESQVAWSKSVDSKLDRNNKAVDDVPEKTSKYIKKHKNGFLKFLGSAFLGLMFFLSKPVRKFLNDIGFGEAFSNIHKIIEEKFPALLPVVDKVTATYNFLKDFVDNSWSFVKKIIGDTYELVTSLYRRWGMEPEEREDFWYDRFAKAGLDKTTNKADYFTVLSDVYKRYGYNEKSRTDRKAVKAALKRIDANKEPTASSVFQRYDLNNEDVVQTQPQSGLGSLQNVDNAVLEASDTVVQSPQEVSGMSGNTYVSQQSNTVVIQNSKNEYTH